jgi:hypothetical protein
MFFKFDIYKPYGKSKVLPYRANLYDDEVANPFEEIETPQEYIDFLEKENSHLYHDVTLNDEDTAKDDILEYILREYS